MKSTLESLNLTKQISASINEQTFHHHYHILYDIPVSGNIHYLEIGCYAGGSAILMLHRPNTTVVSVDLGSPIHPDIVKNNIKNNNPYNNNFYYIQGDSQNLSTLTKVKEVIDRVDILFIDGDHSFQGVVRDFEMYKELVPPGGYIIFDDYNDKESSPEVKPAVDSIIKKLNNYEIIGTIKNDLGARPNTLEDGNCFIIRKIK